MTAKDKAKELFNSHYMILFDSETDKSQEILVSILAIKAAIVTANEVIESRAVDLYWENKTVPENDNLTIFYKKVINELNKM